ncbi:MAG: DUF5305 family protein [Chloroflexi bacterium]|nr:DUF5305 family protein [Chloroflexota bacterium]MDA1146298.1 DUF5305 family protein [Chloroflexota bacterium]
MRDSQERSGAPAVDRRADGDQRGGWRRDWRRDWRREWRGTVPMALMGVVSLGAVLIVVFAMLAFTSFRRSTESSEYVERLQYQQEASMHYEVTMARSSLYPGGVFLPRGPALDTAAFQGVGSTATVDSFSTRLASDLEIGIHYELVSAAFADPAVDPQALAGTVSATLEIQSGRDGWIQVRPLIGTQEFSGPTVDAIGTVNLRGIAALVERIEEETGIVPPQYLLRVVPTIELSGPIGVESIREVFSPVFTFAYNSTQVATDARLVRGESRIIGQDVTSQERISYAGFQGSVSEARQIATAGLALSIAAVAIAGAMLQLGIGSDEDSHIRQRYRSRLVAVATSGSAHPRDTIQLASIQDLARVADRSGGLILSERGHRGTRYFVPDGDEIYEYETVRGERPSSRAAVPEVQ